jgi:predicted nucleotide-binding protein (sugar kinase/HSP70/actin superfamily)
MQAIKCSELIREIGELVKKIDEAEKIVKEEAPKLRIVGRELIWRESPVKINRRINRLIDRGVLKVKDSNICFSENCMDTPRFYKALDDWIESVKELRKLVRDIEYCE